MSYSRRLKRNTSSLCIAGFIRQNGAKRDDWRASQAENGCKCAPLLAFVLHAVRHLRLKLDNQRRVEVRKSEEKISRRYVNDFVACTERHADRIFAFAHFFYLFLEEPPLHDYPNVGRGQMLIRMQ